MRRTRSIGYWWRRSCAAAAEGIAAGVDYGSLGPGRQWRRYWAAEELALGGAGGESVDDGLGPMHGSCIGRRKTEALVCKRFEDTRGFCAKFTLHYACDMFFRTEGVLFSFN